MNMLLKYREENHLTQEALASELQPVCPGIDRVLISKIESGLCAPTDRVKSYIRHKTSEKACAHGVGERKSESRYIYHSQKNNAEIGDFSVLEETVLDALRSASKETPLTRNQLRELTGMKDSRARDVIGRLRDRGCRIVGSAGAKGYWIAESESDYLSFRREYERKALTFLSRIVAMDAYTEGQTSMYEEVH